MHSFSLRCLVVPWTSWTLDFWFRLVFASDFSAWFALLHLELCLAALFLPGFAFSAGACLLDSKFRRKCSHFVGTTCAPFRSLLLLMPYRCWALAFARFLLWLPCCTHCVAAWHDLCPLWPQGFSKLSWNLPTRSFVLLKTNAVSGRLRFDFLEFDYTLGYPGEGPDGLMSLWSANIGSFRSNSGWKSWGADVCCLQETRIGKANVRSCGLDVKSLGVRLTTSEPLPVKWHKAGSITPCGGTAIIGPETLIQPFDPASDHTGLYVALYRTQRLNAAWVQVRPKCRALVISIYAAAGASQDPQIHGRNETLFSQVFDFVSQFGQISDTNYHCGGHAG